MSKFKILYAEDDETLAFLTKDNLEQNYNVSHCADGKEALELFKKESFDICIFDIMMPKMDGFELAESVRKLNADVPIIFLSAKTLKEDRIKGLRIGADDYLVLDGGGARLLVLRHRSAGGLDPVSVARCILSLALVHFSVPSPGPHCA